MTESLIEQIIRDMVQPVKFIPAGMLLGTVALVLWSVYGRITGKKKNRGRYFLLYLTAIYLTVLLMMTIFSREPGSRQGIHLGFLETLGNTVEGHAYFAENIMLFIPYGVLLPMVFPWFQKGGNCIFSGMMVSILLETVQLLTGMGYCQLDDVVTNTTGTLIGWMVFAIISKYLSLKPEKGRM